jgi:YHS domain-containing protein
MKKLTAIIGLSLLLCSCAAPATQPVDKCLFQPNKDAKVYSEYNGTKVGFCCKKCKGKFDGMSDAEKAAKLVAKNK